MTNAPDETVDFGFERVAPEEKTARVRGVFRSVADSYDIMNDLMSAGVHRIWKAAFVARVNPQPGETLIDCAGGTGDIARALIDRAEAARARRGGAPAQCFVTDINEAMIRAGLKRGDAGLAWAVADAQKLPFPDACADAVTISFGIRNVTDKPAALREFRRILKPGGRFACLEFSRPTSAALRAAYDAYSFAVIPRIGEIVAKDRASYQYLVESIRKFPDQDAFAAMCREAGFSRVSATNFTGGVAAMHVGWAV